MSWILVGVVVIVLVAIPVAIAFIDHYFNVKVRVGRAANITKTTESNKNGFTEKKLNAAGSAFDAIVIGSGIGGLTTAALLARRGMKILVLEQHDTLGGTTHSFDEKGFEFDTGVHYIGADVGNKKSGFGYLFDLLSLGRVTWQKMNKTFDIASISPSLRQQHKLSKDAEPKVKKFSFTSDAQETKRRLCETFPSDKKGIEEFYRLVGWAANFTFPLLVALKMLPISIGEFIFRRISWLLFDSLIGNSTFDVVRSCVGDEECAGILSYSWGDYGTPPGVSPFMIHAMLYEHFKDGAYYPNGGPSTIANSFVPLIEASGGRAFVRAPVSQILLNSEGTAVAGVVVKDVNIFAPIVISAAGVLATYTRLIPPSAKCPFADNVRKNLKLRDAREDFNPRKSVSDKGHSGEATLFGELDPKGPLEPSCAMFTVFIGMDGSPKELGMESTNHWLFPSWRHDEDCARYEKMEEACLKKLYEKGAAAVNEPDDELARLQDDIPLPLVFVASGAAKDGQWNESHPNKAAIELVTAASYRTFLLLANKGAQGKPGGRGPAYEELKTRVQEKLLAVFRDHFPRLADRIVHVSSGTPLTNNFYIGSTEGEVYGLSNTIPRFHSLEYFKFLRPRQQGVKGLYLSGQDVSCNGICGGMAGGLMAAIAIDWTVMVDLVVSYIVEYL